MIHTKSLIRRLDFVPWLLAALFLVWTGRLSRGGSGPIGLL